MSGVIGCHLIAAGPGAEALREPIFPFRQSVATACATEGNWRLVVNQFAEAIGVEGWAVGEACRYYRVALLLNSKADEVLANDRDFCGAEPMIR